MIGEKGTGKTAFAVYFCNNALNNNIAQLNYIRETDYNKFIELKKLKHLKLTDYIHVWKVIIYLLLAEKLGQRERKVPFLAGFSKFNKIKNAIDDYYSSAFSPEIIYALNFVEESEIAAGLISKYAKISGKDKYSLGFSKSRFQTNMMYIEKQFEEAFKELKLAEDHVLLIDGIDIRPSWIDHEDYLECVKGLANAIWSLNNDFFPSIKDTKGRMRVVLLVRPDIFSSIGLQNTNNKIRDNSILLDWRTTYKTYINSNLFLLTDKLLSSQQEISSDLGEAWNYYFPYKIKYDDWRDKEDDDSFISFLRYSLYRPRDIITMLRILQENHIIKNENRNYFTYSDFESPQFKKKYSEYLLGEIQDHLSFYHTKEDYGLFIRFFTYLKGKTKFSYNDYLMAFDELSRYINNNNMNKPQFFEEADLFLQYLYELNVICYIQEAEDREFIRWCFRDRSVSNISPKVVTHAKYEIQYGLSKSLNLGKRFR